MDKELIGKIRCMLDFIETYDEQLGEAKRTGDTEWKNDLYAGLSHAEHDIRECVSRLFGDREDAVTSASNEGVF
ncbi:MAG: hypothetical protein J5486_03930 [Bacteroidaceae bacterium]|nr:hypothetical protein [Bacteroidaceae bacterium]